MTRASTLVVGLGNPILGDDGVGWHAAQALQERISSADVEVACLALGGIALMERLVGYRRALIIDAMTTGAPPGTVLSVPLEELPNPASGHTASSHDTSLATALLLGRKLGAPLPDEVRVVSVEAQRLYEFTAGLSPAVAAAVAGAVRHVEAWLADVRQPDATTSSKVLTRVSGRC